MAVVCNYSNAKLVRKTEPGRLPGFVVLQLHSTNSGTSFLQGITYAYNERDWLLSSIAPLFAMQLQYNLNPANLTGFTAPRPVKHAA